MKISNEFIKIVYLRAFRAAQNDIKSEDERANQVYELDLKASIQAKKIGRAV